MISEEEARDELAAFVRQDGDQPVPPPAPEEGAGVHAGAPVLTLDKLIMPTETVRYHGALYELRYLMHYSLGRQISLVNDRNLALGYMRREQTGEILTDDEQQEYRFYGLRVVAAALPDLPADERVNMLDQDIEALATLFFRRSNEIRAGTGAATASPPTSAASSPASSVSTAATPARGRRSTRASSTPTPPS